MSYRILVTGSRDWEDKYTIEMELYLIRWGDRYEEDFVVVHGECPTGADQMADEWANRTTGVTPERHPADWDTLGKAAGPTRNAEMVAAGADLCLAFIKNNSRGATDCADKAEAAGIPTRRYRA